MSYPLFHPACSRSPAKDLSAEQFAEEFPAESESIEFKESVPLDQIAKTAVAFSNTDGGVILLGVSDTGQIKGLSLSSDKETDIHNRLAPVGGLGDYRIHRLRVEGRDVAAIGVDRVRDGFAQLSNGQVVERRGASNHTLMGSQLADFMARRFVRAPETAATEASADQIDHDLALQLAAAWEWNIAGEQDLLMQRLRDNAFLIAAGHDERLSVAGALYLMADPGQVLGKAYVEVFRYRGDGLDYDRRAEFRGPLPEQVRSAAAFVLDELGFDMTVVGVDRHELHRLPRTALREAIANAVAHRSYAATGEAVRIEMRPDRVVVRSPGALPGGVTLADIADRSVPRNVLVIRTLRFFGVAEDAGRGVDLMQRHMALNFMAPPHFESRRRIGDSHAAPRFGGDSRRTRADREDAGSRGRGVDSAAFCRRARTDRSRRARDKPTGCDALAARRQRNNAHQRAGAGTARSRRPRKPDGTPTPSRSQPARTARHRLGDSL
ncbi:MAG: hypothetical protein F4Z00_04085 [Acidimicrobiaceae bacterium]|nr:hypothetical protein [Acidimicrobiaceae bacterium]MYF41673.1 hypothetical protein [Acidimicrobiaceae bacterium]